MNFNEYQQASRKYDKSVGTDWYYTLGLTGEAGEVAEIIKKSYRIVPFRKDVDAHGLAFELGDVLWYLAALADKYGFTLDDIAIMNLAKLEARSNPGSH